MRAQAGVRGAVATGPAGGGTDQLARSLSRATLTGGSRNPGMVGRCFPRLAGRSPGARCGRGPQGPVFHVGRRARAGAQVTARAGAQGGGRSRQRGSGGTCGPGSSTSLRAAPGRPGRPPGPLCFVHSPRGGRPVQRPRAARAAGGRRRRGAGRVAADSGRHPSRPGRRRRPGPLRRRGGRLHDAADQVRPRRGTRRPRNAPPMGGRALVPTSRAGGGRSWAWPAYRPGSGTGGRPGWR